MARNPVAYCKSLLRQSDHEHYLVGLMLPSVEQRHCFFAVRALNLELARVVDEGTNRDPVLARLVWWRDALASMYKHKGQGEHFCASPLVCLLTRRCSTRASHLGGHAGAHCVRPTHAAVCDAPRGGA